MSVNNQEYRGIYYKGLNYSTKEVNQNFKIKVSGMNDDTKLHTLVGLSGLMEIVGDSEKVNNMLKKAFNKGQDKVECKLRRGLKVVFYTF
ncbi:MAG: ribosomal large subunit pseudouridine synthase B [Bacteroides xylanisolvens]